MSDIEDFGLHSRDCLQLHCWRGAGGVLDLDVESRWQHGFDRAAKPQMGHHASCWALHSQLGQGVGLQSTLEDSSGA